LRNHPRRIATRTLLAGLCLLAASPGDARAQDPETAVRAALARWTETFNAREGDAVCDLFAPDLLASNRDAPDRAFDDVCAQLRRVPAEPGRSYRHRADIRRSSPQVT
jgi:hypothetical protein